MKIFALPVWVILAYLRLSYSACPGEWFGLNCQYKCRCTEDKCDPVTGTCLGGARCQLGWFGPECQYVDLAHSYAALDYPFPVDVVVDGKEDTCADVSDVTLSLTVPLQLSWFRAYVGDSYYRDKLNIQFKEQINSPLLACENKRTALVSDTAVDIHCDLDIEVTQVILKFDSVQSLCSFYISGGRNVALRQQTAQSSDYDVKFAPASNAVNGNTSKGYFTGSCTHTKLGDSEPTWNVTIDKPRAVNRYVIHNRDEGNHIKNRLIGFHLASYDSAGAEVFHFIERTPNAQNVYTVTSPTKEVQTVSIYVQKVEGASESPLLNLCEVEVYGDSVCESGLYGRDCEHKCNCADSNNTCFVSTGGCPYGCPPGFQGDSCTEGCDRQTYGQDCNSTCPQYCEILNTILSVCYHISGVCTQGCLPGYKGDRCDERCDRQTYGQDCNSTCPQHCEILNTSLSVCHHISGVCTQGCLPGYKGARCDERCDRQTYGQDCNSTCPQHCENLNTSLSVCHHISGVCTQGCLPGYKGDRCDKRCDRQTYGQDCNSTCPQHCEILITSMSVCHHISGVCTQGCLPGYKGDRCDERCDRQTYGQDCNSTCPQHCEILITSMSVCHHISGVCTQGCLPGYKGDRCDERCDRQTYGQDCNSTCPQHCENLNTSLSVCHHISGVCTQGCLPGYKGDRCDKRCDRQTYGQDCNSTCPQHCEILITSMSVCHHISGVCTQRCLPGYKGDRCDERCDRQTYGQDCNSTCPQHCENLNTSLSVCHHISGVCTQRCLPGYKGDRCDKQCNRQTHGQDCSSTCPQHCEILNASLSVCHHISGVCTQGCLPGYKGARCDEQCNRQTHGQDCNYTCPQHCENLNTSLSVCHHISGVCTQGCLPGYKGIHCDEQCDSQTHGQDCNYTCSQHCENLNTSLSVCHHISGVCTQGCLPGYSGIHCHEQCDRGTYGLDCNSTCPQHCENMNTSPSVCHHISGVCSQGCLPGLKGVHCDESKTNTARKEDSSPGYSTTLWAVAGCIIVVVLVVVGLIVLWKFKNLKSYTIWTYSCKNLQKSDSTEMIVTTETSVVDESVFH